MPVIGWLSGISPGVSEPMLAAFRKALEEAGFIEHRNVGIEYRWAEGHYDRLPVLAADLVAEKSNGALRLPLLRMACER
jgi:putative tryptophan/tyrosine transport system substrate-binding protein